MEVGRFDLCSDDFDLNYKAYDLIIHNHVLEHLTARSGSSCSVRQPQDDQERAAKNFRLHRIRIGPHFHAKWRAHAR